jgi:hypothetical protein
VWLYEKCLHVLISGHGHRDARRALLTVWILDDQSDHLGTPLCCGGEHPDASDLLVSHERDAKYLTQFRQFPNDA